MPSPPNRPNRLRGCLTPLIMTLIILGITFEIFARFLIHTNLDGGRIFLYVPLRPFQLPLEETRQTLARYAQTTTSGLVYDAQLGWTNRPNLPDYNAAGMRADHDYPLTPADDVLRIAVFGDSFTHGNEVERTESWAYQLETMLNAQGIPAEVLNFGVSGYGLDQAYLRWQEQGHAYRPDIVMVGFVELLIPRMVEFYWKFHPDVQIAVDGNPFMKPRFILENGTLRLLNSPTPAPEALVDFLSNFPASDLAPYERAFNPDSYHDQWWLNSASLAVMDGIQRYVVFDPTKQPMLTVDYRNQYDVMVTPTGEAYQLATSVLQQWQAAAEADGSRFMLANLPHEAVIRPYQQGQPVYYQALLDTISTQYEWIETVDAFPTSDLAGMFHPGGHYSPAGNALSARVIADYLAAYPDQITSRALPFG